MATQPEGKYAIHEAAREGKTSVVESMLNANPTLLLLPDEDSRFPLHWSCTTASLPTTTLLLTHPASLPKRNIEDLLLDARDSSNWTPLMIAASVPDGLPLVELLLSRGADPNLTSSGGQTALHFAASKGHLDTCRVLVNGEGRKSVRVRDRRGQVPLHRAAAVGNIPILKLLVKEGKSPVDGGDVDGMTGLHHAIAEGHGDAALFLLQNGAEPDKKDREGRLPLDLAPDAKVRSYIVQAAEREGIELPGV